MNEPASEEDRLIANASSSEPSAAPVQSCSKHNNDLQERRMLARMETASQCGSVDEKPADNNSRRVLLMIIFTFSFFTVELTVGFINRSIALLADSYHMLSDVMALTVAYVCLKISQRKSKRNGFGWVRAEVVGALVNGVFLLAMCFTISMESIGRFIHPRPMTHPLQVLVVGVIGLFINLIGIAMFHGGHGHSHGGSGGHGHSHGGHGHSHGNNGHGHSHDGSKHHSPQEKRKELTEPQVLQKERNESGDSPDDDLSAGRDNKLRSLSHISQDCHHNHLALKLVNLDENNAEEEFTSDEHRNRKQIEAENLNMRGVFLHIISDAIGSVFVVIAASIAYFAPKSLTVLNLYLDPALSLTLVCLICFSAYALVKETAAIVLRRTPVFVDLDSIKSNVEKIRGVAQVRNTTAWTLVGNRHLATAEIEFCTPLAFDAAVPKIRRVFHKNGIHSLTIQPVFSCMVEAHVETKTTDYSTSASSPLLEKSA